MLKPPVPPVIALLAAEPQPIHRVIVVVVPPAVDGYAEVAHRREAGASPDKLELYYRPPLLGPDEHALGPVWAYIRIEWVVVVVAVVIVPVWICFVLGLL